MEDNAISGAAMPQTERETVLEQPRMMVSDYIPSQAQVLREYDINISFLDRGCIVKVGCKSIAFLSAESAMEAINDYIANPYEQQKQWRVALEK
jgi:hypothetical protein